MQLSESLKGVRLQRHKQKSAEVLMKNISAASLTKTADLALLGNGGALFTTSGADRATTHFNELVERSHPIEQQHDQNW